MRGVVYSTAVGCGCLLGVGASPSHAADWSLQPSFSLSADYDSNRALQLNGQGSEQGVLSGDLLMRRSMENSEISLEPKFAIRRFTDRRYGNGDDLSAAGGYVHSTERTQLNLTGSVADQSTLTTELLETGIVQGDSHRVTLQGGSTWSWARTERRQLFFQATFSDVSYHGTASALLPGYRYPNAALGERFFVSDRTTLAFSAFGDALLSSTAGNSSHEAGVQVEYTHTLSERNNIDIAVGESQRSLTGDRSFGTNGSVSLTRNMLLGNVGLTYTRSLVPYGTGFLVERQQLSATASRPLTEYLIADMTVYRIENNQSAARLHLDRRSLDGASMGLNWRPSETWTLRSEVSASRTEPFGSLGSRETVHEWRTAMTLTWRPLQIERSR
jgi:hypothetical protein